MSPFMLFLTMTMVKKETQSINLKAFRHYLVLLWSGEM